MGRMADIWKTADRGPATPLPMRGALSAIDAVPSAVPTIDFADEDDVPFIEVGGPRPVMKHLDPIAPAMTKPQLIAPQPVVEATPRTPAVAVMNVRFEAVHIGRSAGRSLGPELIAFHQPNHAVSVQYRSLIAEMAAQLPGSKPRAIVVSSATAGAGGTTVALNLGITLAKQDGTRATIVDANFAKPDLAARLGIAGSPGLRDVLTRQTPIAWSLQETPQDNLIALPAGKPDAPTSSSIAAIIEQLRTRSDWVIIDAGTWTGGMVATAEACDAVYLVHSESDRTASERVSEILGATGRLRGCIVTQR